MEKPDEKNNEYSYPKKWKYWQLKKKLLLKQMSNWKKNRWMSTNYGQQ